MTVLKTDICFDTNYMNIYVPIDDRIRDKGFLTLISPRYAFILSNILTVITKGTTVDNDSTKFNNVDKEQIKAQLFDIKEDSNKDYVMCLLHKIKEIPSLSTIDSEQIRLLIYDLVERVLNAIVGGQVKNFRTKKLSRVNDVTFRTMLKTKCEEGNV